MKNKYLTIIAILLTAIASNAQEDINKKYSLISATNNVSLLTLSLTDPYLSPLTYNGFGIQYDRTEQKYFNPENINFSERSHLSALTGITANSNYSSDIIYNGISYSWSALYHYRKFSNLQIMVGSSIDGLFAFKSNTRNTNNPINLDIATNINLEAILHYNLKLKRKTLHLVYQLSTPVIGCMYVPLIGASYYEMFELGDLKNAIHFSSLHNKTGLQSALSIDIPLKKATLSFGISNQSLIYKANNMVFNLSKSALQFGAKYNFYIFKGKNNPAPSNFVNTDK